MYTLYIMDGAYATNTSAVMHSALIKLRTMLLNSLLDVESGHDSRERNNMFIYNKSAQYCMARTLYPRTALHNLSVYNL